MTIILLEILYGRETWSPTLREVHTLRVHQSRVLSRIFGPKRDELTGGRRKVHNEEEYEISVACSKHEWVRRETCIVYW
jgi:hypothetical protein